MSNILVYAALSPNCQKSKRNYMSSQHLAQSSVSVVKGGG